MLKLVKYLLWILVLLALCLGLDQLLLRTPLDAPGLAQTQRFYVDFRQRLIRLFFAERAQQPGASIEGLIEETAPAESVQPGPPGNRYLYVDDDGVLQFADSLQQVPARYRESAQPLAD